MQTQTDICNQALAMVSEGNILSIDDPNPRARLCKTHYASTMREVLRSGTWRCARGRKVLSRMADPPAFGWKHQYQLPDDFVRVITLNDADTLSQACPLFEVEGRRLLTNEGMVNLVYVRDMSNEDARNNSAELDPLTARAVAVLLASKLAWPLQQSRTLRESLLREYDLALSDARTANARDAKDRIPPDTEGSQWFPSRF